MTASLEILYISLFTSHRNIRRYIIWDTDSELKWTTKKKKKKKKGRLYIANDIRTDFVVSWQNLAACMLNAAASLQYV
jgi:hypothetical protein